MKQCTAKFWPEVEPPHFCTWPYLNTDNIFKPQSLYNWCAVSLSWHQPLLGLMTRC